MNIFAPKNYVVYIKENNSNTMLSPNISKWDDNSYVYYSSSRASSVSKPSIIGTTEYAYYEYKPKRDLLAQVRNHINGGVISQYDYENDAAGRRVAVSRSGSMMSETRTDYYGYNYRDELISATKRPAPSEGKFILITWGWSQLAGVWYNIRATWRMAASASMHGGVFIPLTKIRSGASKVH